MGNQRRTRITIFAPDRGSGPCAACGLDDFPTHPVYLGTGRVKGGLAHGKVEFDLCFLCIQALAYATAAFVEQIEQAGRDILDKTKTGEDPDSVGTTVPVDEDSDES